jgi:hypothetical protein
MQALDASGNRVLLLLTGTLSCAGGDDEILSTADGFGGCGSLAGGEQFFKCCSKDVYLM